MQITSRSGHQRPWWLAVGLLVCLFVSNLASAASVPQVARRSGEWTEHPSLHYAGEGFAIHKAPRGSQILIHRYLPYDDIAVIPSSIHDFRPNEVKQIFKAIPALKPLERNGWSWNRLQDKPVVGQHFDDPAGIYTLPDRKPHSVRVRSKGGRFEFNYLGKNALGFETRKWSTFEDLPEHMQKFLRRYAQSDRSVPWMSVLRSLRKRSLDDAAELHKRAPPQDKTMIAYPGKKIIITREPSDPRTPYRISVLTEDARNIVGTSKWSELPPELRSHLSQQVPNIGLFASSNLPESDAARWQIKLGTHAFDNDAAYAHPDFPPELIQVVRLPSGKIVFQRNFGQTFKFSQLPDHLRAYLQNQPDLREMLADAKEATPKLGLPQRSFRFLKRAPPQYLQTVEYPGKRIVVTREASDASTPYRFHTLSEDGQTVKSSSKWSDLPQRLRQRLDSAHPNLGFVASSAMSAQDAAASHIRLGEHAYDHASGYAHPDFPAETVSILRKSSGKIVFQRGSGEAVKFSQLPQHLQTYLHSQRGLQGLLAEATRASGFGFPQRGFRFFKRAPPKPTMDQPLHTIPYHGERITLTQDRDGKYVFNFLRLRSDGGPEKLYRSTRWNALPSELREHFAGIPSVKIVATSTMSPEYARTLPVMVADEPFDLTQAFHHPERTPETISVWPTDQGIMYQRQTATRVHGLQPLESLPEHLQTYLRAQPSMQNVLRWGRRIP